MSKIVLNGQRHALSLGQCSRSRVLHNGSRISIGSVTLMYLNKKCRMKDMNLLKKHSRLFLTSFSDFCPQSITIMEELEKLLSKIDIPSHQVTLDLIQGILIKAKRHKFDECNTEYWSQVCQVLWKHLLMGLKKFDDQLLCATCFCTIIPLTDKQDYYIKEMLNIIEIELNLKNLDKVSTNLLQAVSIMYGMFQSTFLTQNFDRDTNIKEAILKSTFELLTLMAYEYSQYTFIVFKTIKTFSKVCGNYFQNIIFNRDNQVKLLNLVNHNWENPITGVRDLNRDIFQTLLSSVDNEMYKLILDEINVFYWNKAKYLMISEIIEHCNNNIYHILQKNNCVDGLIYSLHKPGLVSAGADMYYAILKKLRSETEWCTLLLQDIMKIANSKSYKAIENFNNYWCLTTLKKYPTLINVFLDELQNFDDTEQKLYSSLFIIKQANKLGIISKNWASPMHYKFTENMVLRGIESYNNHIRMLAFDIVCMTQAKVIPGKVEFDLILIFLNNNINSDCSVLRLSMLSRLNQFLLQLHATFLNTIKNKQHLDEENLLYFCNRIQEIIIDSLSLNGNYQRKITCVKVANTVFICLSYIPNKKKDQNRVISTSLIDFLKDKDCWMLSTKAVTGKFIDLLKDPADDIRENVVQLLLNHYPKEILRVDLISDLIDNAMECLKSKFFFEISCGQSIFKLVVSLMLRYEYKEGTFKNVDEVFLFASKELIAEYRVNRDVLTSIESGKQLHSFMSILLVTLEACILNSYKMESINMIISDLLDALEGISNQFSLEQENSTSYDFSKMSEMVQNMITQSGYNTTQDGHDETKISGLHQIVLNCIWLNVKASCDLASLLIKYYTGEFGICQRCLVIITHVLETSRHKGAIEAGGAALGRGIQHLTSQSEETNISELPQYLLKSKLNDLLSETNRMASITRRGAGLSIMVHRIVSSDMRKGKPLFHYFMEILLETCNMTDDVPDIQTSSKTENEMDLPKAIYIHFLTRIVTDSSLASDLMYYSAELAELAFLNLTSPHWQIRNAALQLYGALIPRQIGQKKASGSDDETIATVAYDELRTHSPKLWKYIMRQLKNDSALEEVLSHSNLVPILNILANSAKRYNFSNDMAAQKNFDAELLASLILLLGSPIYTVRRLTAKCIFNIYSFDAIYYVIINQEYMSENLLHGSLILIENCNKYYAKEHGYEDRFMKLREKFKLLTTSPHSYLCKDIFENIFTVYDFPANYLEETKLQLNSSNHIPGIFYWADNRFRKYILNNTWDDIPQALEISLDCSDFINYCEFLYLKIEKDKNISDKVLQNIVDILLSYDKKYNSSIIWKIIYHLSQLTKLEVDITPILEHYEHIQINYKLRYIIPLAARECTNIVGNVNNNQLKIANIIYKLCGLENSDVDMRYIAALANNELANVFNQLSDSVRVISIKTAVILLQDEDEDVRMLSVHFYKNINKLDVAVHPYVCLHNILDHKFMHEVLINAQQEIKDLCIDLSEKLLCTNCINDEYNPFANDSKNIYLEGNVLRALLKNLMSD